MQKDETRIRHHDDQLQAGNTYSRAMDEALESDPPVIEWERNAKGVYVAVSVADPHVVTPNKPKRTEP